MSGMHGVLMRAGEIITRQVERATGTKNLWDTTLRPVIDQGLRDANLPDKPMDPVEMARHFGLLKDSPKKRRPRVRA